MKRILPPTWLLLAVGLTLLLHWLAPLRRVLAFPWRLLGLVPLAGGIALNLLADRAFKKRNTTVKPFEEPTALITDGVFRISRNPMYLGMALILLGVAALCGTAGPFIVPSAFALFVDRAYIAPEERNMEETFGDGFRRYRRRVRRRI